MFWRNFWCPDFVLVLGDNFFAYKNIKNDLIMNKRHQLELNMFQTTQAYLATTPAFMVVPPAFTMAKMH